MEKNGRLIAKRGEKNESFLALGGHDQNEVKRQRFSKEGVNASNPKSRGKNPTMRENQGQ